MKTPRGLVAPALLALGALLAGCPGPPATSRGDAARAPAAPAATAPAQGGPSGEELFKRSCSACHGPDAKGLPSLGSDLVGGAFARTKSDAELLDFVKKGRAADDPASVTKVPMPPKGGNPALKDAEILSIVAHLRALQGAQ